MRLLGFLKTVFHVVATLVGFLFALPCLIRLSLDIVLCRLPEDSPEPMEPDGYDIPTHGYRPWPVESSSDHKTNAQERSSQGGL